MLPVYHLYQAACNMLPGHHPYQATRGLQHVTWLSPLPGCMRLATCYLVITPTWLVTTSPRPSYLVFTHTLKPMNLSALDTQVRSPASRGQSLSWRR